MSELGACHFGNVTITQPLLLKPSPENQRELSYAPNNFVAHRIFSKALWATLRDDVRYLTELRAQPLLECSTAVLQRLR